MRIILLSFITLICLSASSCWGQITLEDCQSKARENFPLIKQYDLIEQSREYNLSNANKGYLPQLDVTLIGGVISGMPSFAPPGTESGSSTDMQMISILQLNQVIWDGGITKAKKGIIEASSEMEKAELEVNLYSLEDRVNNLYFAILLIDEQVVQLEILKSTLGRNRKRVQIAIDNGTAFRSDIDEIQVEIINAEQKIEELKYNRNAYLNVLAAMIGEQLSEKTQLQRPQIEEDILVLENQRPELSIFYNHKNLINAQSAIDKSMLYPKIGILAFGTGIQPGIDFGASTLDYIFVGGLSINWSLGAMYKNGNNKKLTEINLQKVQVQRETFLFNNNLELTQTKLDLQKYKRLIEQDRELLALKTSIKNAYEIKYDNGISTMSQLLDRTNEENIAQQNLIVHEIQYLMKAYQYKNKTGN